jgi:CBS domain-containing protein
MRVFEIMSDAVRTVPPSLPAAEAWQVMKTEGIHHLVVTTGRRIVGVLSSEDAGGRTGSSLRAGKLVEDLMSRPVVTVKKTDTVRRAANVMRGRTIGCLPVTDGTKLVGVITTSDLLNVVGHGNDERPRPERRNLSHRVPHKKQQAGTGLW